MATPPVACVLVVEDQSDVRGFICKILADAGYTALEADDGAVAAQIFGSNCGNIDLVIMDLVMPGAGGLDVANEFLALRPETKILYISGYGESVAAQSIHNALPCVILPKPFTADQLLSRVREMCKPMWLSA